VLEAHVGVDLDDEQRLRACLAGQRAADAAHFGEVGRDFGGHHQVGMATSGSLGDVQREITHALDVARGVQCGHDDAQVGSYGCLLCEQGERLLFSCGAEVVDAGVAGDDLLGQPQVRAEQRTSGVVKGLGYQVAHIGKTVGESVELHLVGVAHGERVAAFDCR
jgi:hypothetical protein